MYYIDDSGIPSSGLALYTAVGVPKAEAARVLRVWQELRDRWSRDHGIPPEYELHANNFLAGRGRPGGRNPLKIERYRMAQEALDVIAAQPGLDIVTVYTQDATHWGRAKRRAYDRLLRVLDQRLAEAGETAALVVDGDGSEHLYDEVHLSLRPSRIPLSAVAIPAHVSTWLQMADLVAYCGCQAIARQENRRFMWGWYGRHLPKALAPERC
ncbi:DUF3800 domain-containing protein [Streptomyces sp. NBC_00582]|uniref:DUF3800 domain-containing protein n=1 Tax=Streptomyces sp. NBC_00582 TaxID=2975783 RepID=UPI002E81BD21|nr:DUF3800 domain-containing protein [Streptomyces sp. NBC_00582]WUB65435.1 hypothetical protein OG852_35980 [Streptomyces sp. NBC_00582]